MAEIRMYTKEELARMPFGEIVNHINKLYAGYYKYKNEALYKENCLATNERIRENILNKNAELKDTIEHQKDEIVKLKNAIEGYRNKLDEKEDYIGRLQMQITDMQEEIQKRKAELNSPIGYLDLDSLDKQNELERLKNLLKGKDYTIEQQLKVDEQDTIGYAPVNFVLEDSNSSYSEYAEHLMRKYEALTDSGFSHDDAMSLIPWWDDADFEEFKKGN